MAIALNILYLAVVIIISPVFFYRMVRHKRYRKGWSQKLGNITRNEPAKKCIWIHAVSVGEVNATKTIINALSDKFSEFEIVISTTTDTGFERASKLFGQNHAVFYFPFDFSWIIRKAFEAIRPDICMLMELEVWPNFVDTAKKLNVPVVIVNGRISEKSFSRYKLIKPFVKKIFEKITLTLAQTEQYADRFQQVGVSKQNIIVTGSLKYDTAEIAGKIDGADSVAAQLGIENKKLWVAGGTGNNEEAVILEVFRNLLQKNPLPDLRLVIVPRKPERFNEVAQIIKQRGFGCIRYSQIKQSSSSPVMDNQTVILVDTMGDLRKFYSLATVIFVGRSLVPMGGSDMAEAAALGKCTIFGAHAFNFKQTVDALLEAEGAIMIENKTELLNTVQKCLLQPDYANQIAANGQQIIKQNQGATKKTVRQITKLLTGK